MEAALSRTLLTTPASTLLTALAEAAPECVSLEPPRPGREGEGPIVRWARGGDTGSARARLVAAVAAGRAEDARHAVHGVK